MNRWGGIGAALLSACLMAVAQNYAWAGWLAMIALVPLLLAIASGGFAAVSIRLGAFYALHTVLTLGWIRHTGPGVIWLLPVAILYLLAFLSLPAVCVRLAGSRLARLIAVAPALTLFELLLRLTALRISWTLLGLPLADYAPMSQLAAIGGPESITFLAVVCNAAVAGAFLAEERLWKLVSVGAGVFAVFAALGWAALNLNVAPVSSRSLRAGLVQPMNSQRLVWTAENRKPVLEAMNRLLDEAARPRPDLLVLPETALSGLVRHDPELAAFAKNAVRRTAIPLLFGSADLEQERYSNSAFFITTDDRVFTYRKQSLVPFIEYTPWGVPYTPPANWIRFTPGTEATVFPFRPGWNLGPMICLEDTLPELARDLANNGADVLVALINTENFSATAESLQHLRRARLVSIAVGLPMLRAANSGISGVLDSRGRLLQSLRAGQPAAAVADVPLDGIKTIYRRAGDLPLIGIMILLIAISRPLAGAARASDTGGEAKH